MNAVHVRQERDNEQYDNVRNRDLREEAREREGWIRNTRVVLLYFFAAFVIIRVWILVVATNNRVYISITAIAMGILLGFYLRWRRRYVMMLREEYANRQQERDAPSGTIQEFLNIQAAIRAAQNGGIVTSAGSYLPNSMSLLVAALPTIVYQPVVSQSLPPPKNVSHQNLLSSFITGPVSGGSAKVAPVPVPLPGTSIQTGADLESGGDKGESQDPLCMVCLEYFQAGDILTCLPCACAHKYHRVCLIAWLERKTTCPLCTQSVSLMLLPPDLGSAGAAAGVGGETTVPTGNSSLTVTTGIPSTPTSAGATGLPHLNPALRPWTEMNRGNGRDGGMN